MDNEKVGSLIAGLRREKNMTQKQLADQMHLSDKTVSKWERGLGCPDVSLLPALADILGVQIEQLLMGRQPAGDQDGGNMKKLKFYVCPTCGSVFTATKNGEITCCGRKLSPLTAKETDEAHSPLVETVEDDYFVTFPHEMTKKHHIMFAAHLRYDRVLLVRLYPEQNPEVRFPKMGRGELYFYCSKDGLMKRTL